MSNQLQITGGAKVRSLEGVITGTSGVLSSVPLGGANGVATLDSSGKVPVSQLPASVVTYLGTWNAATNTPTLTNGVGDAGDLYICNVAGTVNFGAGPITFAVGDWVIYGSGTWQKSSGQNGTVTSVAMSVPSGLSVTGSPITTAGTLAVSLASGYTIPLSTQLVPTGGTTGQILAKNSNTAYDTTWIDNYTEQLRDTVKASVAINKGQAVYISGANGTNQLVSLADNSSEATSSKTLGLAMQNFAINDIGQIITEGLLGGLDTSTATAGDPVWLGVNGNLIFGLANKPAAPAHLVYIGVVTRVNVNNGEIYVKIQNGFELQELHNVSITSPTNGDILEYDSATSLWKNVAGSTTNITEGTNLYFTNARARGALSFTAGSGAYNSTTGVITIPTNTNQLTNGASFITLTSLSAGTGISYNNTTGVISSTITQYTDAMARASISLTTTGTSGAATYNSTTGVLNIPQYTPDLSGYVTLGTTQTITGAKTFNLATNNESGIRLKNGFGASATGYTGLGADTNQLWISVTAATHIFDFPSTTGRTYSFPAASGTIALTSDLGAYLPLSGGTLTGALNGTSITLTNDIYLANNKFLYAKKFSGATSYSLIGITSSDKVLIDGSGMGVNFGGTIGNGTYTYTLPSATGTLALTSDLNNYVTLSGASQTISSSKTFTTFPTTFKDVVIDGSGTSASGVNLKIATGGISSAGNGYTLIYSSAAKKISIYDNASNTNGVLDFSAITTNVTRTYAYPDASGTLALTSQLTGGTVTSVTVGTGTTGTDVNANVTAPTTTPLITINIPFASATNTGKLSSTDWTTFNNKQNALTNPITGTGTTNYHAKFTGSTTLGNSLIYDNGSNVTINNTNGVRVLNIYSATADNHLAIYGSAPSVSLSDAPTSASFQAKFGLATTSGQFVTGSSAGDFIISTQNGSTIWAYNSIEVMRINVSGNLGINQSNPTYKLDVNGTARVTGAATFSSTIASSGAITANIGSYNPSFIAIGSASGNGQIQLSGSANYKIGAGTDYGGMAFTVGGSDRIYVLNNGNVGIGTSSPISPANNYRYLHIEGANTTSGGVLYLSTSGNGNSSQIYTDTSGLNINTNTSLPIIFNPAGAERMRITSGGTVVAGSTLNVPTGGEVGAWSWIPSQSRAYFSSDGTQAAAFNRFTTTGNVININYAGTLVGSISTNGSTTSYNTTSDYRLKEDFKDIYGLEKLLNIKVYDFKFKNTNQRMDGVIAHELQEIIPYAVNGTKDAIDDDGNILPQGVDYSLLVPVLVKAIQELSAKVTALENKINK